MLSYIKFACSIDPGNLSPARIQVKGLTGAYVGVKLWYQYRLLDRLLAKATIPKDFLTVAPGTTGRYAIGTGKK